MVISGRIGKSVVKLPVGDDVGKRCTLGQTKDDSNNQDNTTRDEA